MSKTKDIGVYSVGHWRHMATVMAEELLNVTRRKRLENGDVPEGVLDVAKEFYRLTLDGGLKGVPKNPSATARVRSIAYRALLNKPNTLERGFLQLKRLGHFILLDFWPQRLKKENLQIMIDLRRFFLRLSELE